MAITRIEQGQRISQGVVHGNMVYLAGIVASELGADAKGQTEQILRRIDELLAKAGTSKANILSANVWVADMRYYDPMNQAWDVWVDPGNKPARATVEARLATPRHLVE
ncbi:MAG TPA: RidA family protein, partial [Solirubrobacterales bacterium]|nr:RidA family protein [Solirubrobacterales bacterium]